MGLFNRRKFKLDFFVVGVQKGGTSALDSYLKQHPEILMSSKKEIHFFDTDDHFKEAKPNYDILKGYYPSYKKHKLLGEITPSYMYWNPAIERIHRYNSDVKILAILRNPMERAFSNWNMEYARGNESLNFLECIEREISEIDTQTKVQNIYSAYVERGLYRNQMERINAYFSKEQVMYIKYEDFLSHQESTVARVLDFLDVEPFLGTFETKTVNKFDYNRSISEIEKQLLVSYFKDEIDYVETTLGWNCTDWKH